MTRRMRLSKGLNASASLWRTEAALVLSVALAAGLLVGDNLTLYFGLRLLAILVLIPLGLGLGLYVVFTRKTAPFPKQQFGRWIFAVLGVTLFLLGGKVKSVWRVREAKTFVLATVPELDKIKAKTNRYPKKLPPALERKKPLILNYFSGGAEYVFSYTEPLSVDETYHFDSDALFWQRWSRNGN
jgi:hypothetical protein